MIHLEGVEEGGVHVGGEALHEEEDEGDDAELSMGGWMDKDRCDGRMCG